MTVQAATNGKKPRGDGPVSFMFIDGSNKEHKRVADGTSQLKVVAKGGKTKTYNVGTLAPAVLMQLASEAFKKRLDITIRNTVKDDANAEVIAIADDHYAMLKDGKLFSRKEGGAGQGRTFDFDKYVTIFKNAIDAMAKQGAKNKHGAAVKPLTQKQLDDLRTQLESETPKDRGVRIKKWRGNPFYVLSEKEYDMQQAKKDIAEGDFDALF